MSSGSLSKIGFLKNQGISEVDYPNSNYFDPELDYDQACEYCYKYYQEKLKFFNAIDFDDILFLAVELFRKYPEIANKFSEKFKFIMIDEYQDTNNLQFQLVMGLTSKHNNLCVVGDDDQAIYAFRGANIENILNFEKCFPGAKVIKLEENYRSTKPILSLANSIIAQNKKRKDKTLRAQMDSKDIPFLWATGDSDHEAKTVASEIIKHVKRGGNLSEIAILYRGKTQAPILEENLRENMIPYTIIGGQKFYDKKEVKDLIAYLQLILNPSDEIALRRIINVPNRGIGTGTLQKFITHYQANKTTLFRSMESASDLADKRALNVLTFINIIRHHQSLFKSLPLSEAISSLVKEINYLSYIDKQYQQTPKQAEVRKNDIVHFIESSHRFSKYNGDSLRDFIEKVLLQDSQDKDDTKELEKKIKKEEVTMMTLHSSKGLEFDVVFLVGVEEETLPHKKSLLEGEDINEELRLCYVGVTRARKKLYMTYCKERAFYGKKLKRNMSRFVYTLKDKNLFIEQDRTTFDHLSKDEEVEYKRNFFSSLMGKLE